MAKIQGIKPAKRPAAKTVAADDKVRSLRAFPVAHAGAVITAVCESLLAKAGDNIMTSATVSKIAVMQYRAACILFFHILSFALLWLEKEGKLDHDYFDIIFCINDIIPALPTFMGPD
jgi:hypothetical protein